MSVKSSETKRGPFLPLNTIRGRFVFIISVAIIGSILVIQLFSYVMIKRIIEENGFSVMRFATERLSNTLEQEYESLLQISQVMNPNGAVGQPFQKFIKKQNWMEKLEEYETMEKTLTTVTFSSGANVAVYYNKNTNHNYMEGYQNLKDSFSIDQGLYALKETGTVEFHAVHPSQGKYSNQLVVSVTNHDADPENGEIVAYLETPSASQVLLDELRDENASEYIFVQMDNKGCICYSTDDLYPIGMSAAQICKDENITGRWGKYLWAKKELHNGGSVALMLPIKSFYSNLSSQFILVALSLGIAIFLVVITSLLLNQLIIKKNDLLQKQIESVGEGNLCIDYEKTGLLDYDTLLDRFGWMVRQLQQQIRRVEEKEKQRGELEKELLYYRINPHFLLNTLNSAYWIARSNGEERIDQFIAQLISFLRYSLGKDQARPTLRKELKMVDNYIKIQQQRHDFSYTMQVKEGSYLDLQVPRLISQPIAENAIEHGMDEGGHLSVEVFCEDEWITLRFSDNGVGMDEEAIQSIYNNISEPAGSPCIGLRYVYTTMRSSFGERAEMEIGSVKGQGTTVELRIPFVPDEEML